MLESRGDEMSATVPVCIGDPFDGEVVALCASASEVDFRECTSLDAVGAERSRNNLPCLLQCPLGALPKHVQA